MILKNVPIAEIHPYENNPRINDGAVEAVMESIEQCGYCSPILVDENMTILAGHTRLKAVTRLGWTEVPIIIRDDMTEDQKRKYRLLDNKTNEIAVWDFAKLDQELEGLDFDGFDFGFGSLSGGIFDYLSDDFVEKNQDPETFAMTLYIDVGRRDEVEGYIKKNGKDRLVEVVLGEVGNA